MHSRISTLSSTMLKTPTLLQMNFHRGWLLQLRYQPHHNIVVDNASSQVRRMLRIIPNSKTTIGTTTGVESRRFITMTATVSNHKLVFSRRISSLYYYHRPFGITMTQQQQQHRWNSTDNITQKNDIHENEEVNTTTVTTTTTTTATTQEPPKLTMGMKRDLAVLEKRFLRLELEPHGRRRGIEVAQQIIREEKLDKRATKAVANTHLNNWIYRRYSLPLGYDKITDVPSDLLANTLIRDGTSIRFWKYKNAKTILKEMYRYPQRPTTMQQRYLEKDQKATAKADGTDTTIPNNNNNSNIVSTPPLTPEEEEREKRMWDPRLFRPKLYGYKARREALKRKRQK